MYWTEDDDDKQKVDDKVVELVCSIRCRSLPVDHVWALSDALLQQLPWLADGQGAGVLPINIPESGNGWMRPEGADELLHLSRRTKLVLRVPVQRFDDAEALMGKQLDVAGNALEITKLEKRSLQAMETLLAHFMVRDAEVSEQDFLKVTFDELASLGVAVRKMLPGKGRVIRTPDGDLHTSSLMLAELTPEESLIVQQCGIGAHQHLGCGVFTPQKDISEVYEIHE